MKISIVCINKNHGKYIWKCINSIVSQSHTNWELIIADGGSHDESLAVIAGFRDPRIKLLPGTDLSRRDGIIRATAEATGDAMLFTTSTDGYVDSDWFKTAVSTLRGNPDVSLVWGGWTQLKNECLSFTIGPPESRRNDTPMTMFQNWMVSKDIERTFIPELNYCAHAQVFKHCLADSPDYPSINRIDPTLQFHFNFMKEGYISKFIPTIANFGREHENQFQFHETQKQFHVIYQDALEQFKRSFHNGDKQYFIKKPSGEKIFEIKRS
jgi:glycosyltransferase involved in cell wall biosynthesis